VGDLGDLMRATLRQPVTFNRDALKLTIGSASTMVASPAAGNEAMLQAYLALVANVRGTPVGSTTEIRQDDIAALAEILDLTDDDLEQHLCDLLGMTPEDAAEVHRRLRWHRSLIAAATITVGGLTYFGAPAAAAPLAPAPASVVEYVVPGYAVATIGVERTPAPAAAAPSATEPAPADDVEIGDALVIERGDQPADPNMQIGDAVTYER
jgi:hypothetical protein